MKYETTAKRIREAMEEANMTQQELADATQIGKSSISHYVNGTNEPGNKSAFLIAQALHVNPAWIMGLDAPKNISFDASSVDQHELLKALRLYKLYTLAIPQVQNAVEALLKPSQPDP